MNFIREVFNLRRPQRTPSFSPSMLCSKDKKVSDREQPRADAVPAPIPPPPPPRPTTRVSVVGTSGRDAARPLSAALYQRMVCRAIGIIVMDFGLARGDVVLVSGGAAWSDHVAVDLCLQHKFPGLELHLPCAWVGGQRPQHQDNGVSSWISNPGRLANRCHASFSAAVKHNTLQDIEQAVLAGAVVQEHKGFHARNEIVARSPYLVAFSWAENEGALTGGTRHTWNKCRGTKVHVPLSSLEVVPKRKRMDTSSEPADTPGPVKKIKLEVE